MLHKAEFGLVCLHKNAFILLLSNGFKKQFQNDLVQNSMTLICQKRC